MATALRRPTAGVSAEMTQRDFPMPLSLIWTHPRAKGDCRVEGESGCSHIFGLFKELHFTLRALMEIRAPSPGQPNGLEGSGTGQVWKAPVRPVPHHRQNDLRNHGEMCSSDKSVCSGGLVARVGRDCRPIVITAREQRP